MVKKNSRKRRVYKKTRKINKRSHRGGLHGTKKFSKDKNTLFKNIVTSKHRAEVEEIEEKIKEKNKEIERLKKEKKHLEKESKMFSSSVSKPITFLETFEEGEEEE